jgi:carboxypeptidase T
MRARSRFTAVLAVAVAGLALLLPVTSTASAAPGAPDRGVYQVRGADSSTKRTEVARSGVDILTARSGVLTVVATPGEAANLRAAGFRLTGTGDFDRMLAERSGGAAPHRAGDFPPGDEGYHSYAEVTAQLRQTVTDHPNLATLSTVGKSYEGRELNMIKISDNAGTDENEPEVLFTCNQHAREHLTTEMCLHIVSRFTDGYATDPAIKQMVDSREIYVIPNMNPDGSEFDISGGRYHGWRKNRQPNGSGPVGTDLNRNWGYRWGCCGGSSTNPADEDYRGSAAFSAPETRAVADFVNSRVIGGVQQIKAALDLHTYSELVMWPFGYTTAPTAPGLSAEQAARFQDLGNRMAQTNGYTPEQSSALYITDGDITDWSWGQQKILSYVFEMYPTDQGGDGFYPPDEAIQRETTRNDAAIDLLVHAAGEPAAQD